MLNVDPIMFIPVVLTELVNRQEARASFIISDRQMRIIVDQSGSERILWQVEVLTRSTAPTWHIKEYRDVAELRHQGIASEFCERLIQQAEGVGIKHLTAHCSPQSAAFFIRKFGAVRAEDIPQEQRVQIFGRTGLDDGSVGWNLESSLAIFIRCRQPEISRHPVDADTALLLKHLSLA